MLNDLSGLMLPIVILGIVLALIIAIALLSRNYIKVSPNMAASAR